MGRLTEKFVCNLPDKVLEALGVADVPKEEWQIKGTNGNLCSETCKKHLCSGCPIQNAIDKLADYEDAEEKGLLLRLPCKVEDKVYKINPITKNEIVEINIESIFITFGRVSISGRTTIMKYTFCCSPSDFGKSVFATKEEAEQALETMKGGGNDASE